MAKLNIVLATLLRGSLHQFLATLSSARQSSGLALLVGALIYGWNAFQLPQAEAAFRLPLGETGQIKPLLASLFYAWLLVPLVLRGGGLDLAAIKRLRRFPFNRLQSFVIALAEVISAPLVWALLYPTISIFGVLAHAPYPGQAQAGFALFSALCLLLMMTANFLLLLAGISLRKRRQLVLWFVAVGLLVHYLLPGFQAYLPHELLVRLFVDAQPGPLLRLLGLEVLFVTFAMAGTYHFLFYEMRCDSGDDPLPLLARKHEWIPTVRGRWGTFIQMSVLFYYKGVEPVLGLIASVSVCVYLINEVHPEPRAFFFAVSLVTVCHAGIFLNQFGHEGKGILRLHLLPLPGRKIIFLKNVSACLIVLLPMLPLLLIAAFRLGLFQALLGSLIFSGSLLGLAAWGNRVSVKDPAPRTYFVSKRPILTGIYNMVALAVLIGVFSLLVRGDGFSALLSLSILNLCLFIAYRLSLKQAGLVFEEEVLDF